MQKIELTSSMLIPLSDPIDGSEFSVYRKAIMREIHRPVSIEHTLSFFQKAISIASQQRQSSKVYFMFHYFYRINRRKKKTF